MDKVTRLYVEKKEGFQVEAFKLLSQIREHLGVELLSLRLLNRYDIEGVSSDTLKHANNTIFSEPPVDNIYRTLPSIKGAHRIFAVEYLPGQYDQRSDSCEQCIQILTQQERPHIQSAKVYILEGSISDADFERIKTHIINPVESREACLDKPLTLQMTFPEPDDVALIEGFCKLSDEKITEFISSLGLAMDENDLKFCIEYFKDTEKRDPTITELRMIDTYWSDHCRHTTFSTIIDNVTIKDDVVKEAFEKYLKERAKVYGDRHKDITLMDLATIGAKSLKKDGMLPYLDESEEINACSVNIDVEIDGKTEPWLLMFKNETHNHPTEIEPFGGAATCLGGAIRDPLSGRSYVYQAMRVTGSGDPTVPFSETLKGKLPQQVITTKAASGYSSYGNQIGLTTGLVDEIYHPGYVAKRMEVGAVVGAAPKSNVIRETPKPGDVVILLGGKTGRDGCGGATGSSKSHDITSLTSCGAEVQKGNPPEERKIQRLFRNPEVTRLIKRCNDFGAGGVSVAIGELADGLTINLDTIPKKYEGLDGTELAISESQERMAVVIAASDISIFCSLAESENLEATPVATVTEEKRLKMYWRNKLIVSLSREFLNSNGAKAHTDVSVDIPSMPVPSIAKVQSDTLEEKLSSLLSSLSHCSRRGLIENFDSTIGANTVTMPLSGRYQLTPSQHMAAKIPVLEGNTNTCSVMAYGFNPYISSANPFVGSAIAVLDSVAKTVAGGGSLDRCHLSFQEYFPKLGTDPKRWGLPFSALLGAFTAQMGLSIGSIGGKDSMSGSFMDLDVPPTLISFAISTAKADKIPVNHFTEAGNKAALLSIDYKNDGTPNFADAKEKLTLVEKLIADNKVNSIYCLGSGGIAEAIAKMCFGNKLGFRFDESFDISSLFSINYGGMVIELKDGCCCDKLTEIGRTTDNGTIELNGENANIETLINAWEKPLSKVFPTVLKNGSTVPIEKISYEHRSTLSPLVKIAKPKVFIPVFPGTNCEYDTARKFQEAGAEVEVFIFANLNPNMIDRSIEGMVKGINSSQILAIPGGFSGGDEPDGSGKFIATVFKNPKITEAVMNMLYKRDGLALGICNGFQALIKLGLVPFGKIEDLNENSPTLTFNSIGRHQSKYVYTRISSVNSPWFSNVNVGDIYAIPVSHGEGRFVADTAAINMLIASGQVATQYVDLEGNPTMDITYNPNASMMAIEGIFSPDGRILGKMGHSERNGAFIANNIEGKKDQQIFKSGVDYFSL